VADLTEYVDAAARAMYADHCPRHDWDALDPLRQLAYRQSVTPVVAAVAPLIERDARAAALEEAAGEISVPLVIGNGFRVVDADWLRDRARAIREG